MDYHDWAAGPKGRKPYTPTLEDTATFTLTPGVVLKPEVVSAETTAEVEAFNRAFYRLPE